MLFFASLFCCVFSLHPRAERGQGELGDFEKLLSEGDADDRDAQNKADGGVFDGERNAADEKPEDVQNRRARAAAVDNLFAERPERQRGEFETLQPDGDADDRDAPDAARQNP